jgi:hypothetical protein
VDIGNWKFENVNFKMAAYFLGSVIGFVLAYRIVFWFGLLFSRRTTYDRRYYGRCPHLWTLDLVVLGSGLWDLGLEFHIQFNINNGILSLSENKIYYLLNHFLMMSGIWYVLGVRIQILIYY